jgi:hypothetical protein
MSSASKSQSDRSAFTEASVPPSATTADGLTPPRLTPSSPVKDQTPMSSRPWANASFPIDVATPPAPLYRRFRHAPAALAVQAHRCRGLTFCCAKVSGGGDRNRTDDLLLAKQALSQLSYTPKFFGRA